MNPSQSSLDWLPKILHKQWEFAHNQHRMKYAEAKEKNYPIGSGIAEAACKTLVGHRLKRSGMSWQSDGGQGVLTLRSLVKSQQF
jgi:hypothetical protein